MEECSYCHAHACTSSNCRCYILNTGEFLVCTNCYRTQSPIFIPNFPSTNDEIFEIYHGIKQIFMELSQKLNLGDYIGKAAYIKYLDLKNKLKKSTKSNDFIMAHSMIVTCRKFGIMTPLHKIFALFCMNSQNYVKSQKFFLKKQINTECVQKLDDEANLIFIKLEIFSPQIRKKLVMQTCAILKQSDFKITSAASAVYVCYNMMEKNKENFRIFSQFCRKKLGVKFYTIKKIIGIFYKINFNTIVKEITSGSL